uniref:Uncharacterized protein n=1 Tax=Romanomermis culicivorax TaxID=13658 RepID=A0A915IX76_ROMCU
MHLFVATTCEGNIKIAFNFCLCLLKSKVSSVEITTIAEIITSKRFMENKLATMTANNADGAFTPKTLGWKSYRWFDLKQKSDDAQNRQREE